MIQREVQLHADLRTCACGRPPRLIESRGHRDAGPNLVINGAPSLHFHLECALCGITTPRQSSPELAIADWNAAALQPLASSAHAA